MNIVKMPLKNGQYITGIYEKTSIFLHHTSGTNAKSAIRWWDSTPDRVGTPYIIERDGTIFEVFNPDYWAYHLGIIGDDNYHEKHSVNIELVSAGGLQLSSNGEYRFYPLWPNKIRYTVIPENEVYILGKPWRGFNAFHKYTEAQINSLNWLLKDLVIRYPSIDLSGLSPKFYEYNKDISNKRIHGLWAHSSVRRDKSDIYPDKNLIKSLLTLKEELYNTPKPNITPKV